MLQFSLSSQCERVLTLWRDGLIQYENGSPKMDRTSSRHDFSGTNYRSCTLGWLAGIQQKRRVDKFFFERVCNEAREIAQCSLGKGKLDGSHTGDQLEYSDVEIADRAGFKSDESDREDADNQRPSQGRSKGEGHLNAARYDTNDKTIDRNRDSNSTKGKGKRSETDFYPPVGEDTQITEPEETDDENHTLGNRRIFRHNKQ